ncbi:MAG: class I SAM-dependent methyltransferase [Gemmataceae bacterium]
MLPRVLEPEVMDTPEEARDYDAMDHGEVNRLFAADFLRVFTPSLASAILDLGTGTAQIPIELCRQSPAARVVAVDLAAHMLTVAEENVRRAGLAERIRLEKIDAKRLPYADHAFAAVMSNSIVHHIPAPAAVLAEVARVTAFGGVIFIRDLLRPDSLEALRHLVRTYAGDANDHQQKMFGDSLHAALTLEEIRAMVAALGLNPDHVTQTSDRHWTWATVKTKPEA